MKPRFPTRPTEESALAQNPTVRADQEIPGPPPSGPRSPVPAESGNGDSLFPDSRRIGNRGLPVSRFPAKSGIGDSLPDSRESRPNRESGNRGNGNWEFGPLAHGSCNEPLAATADVRWRPEIGIFQGQRRHLAPPDRVWYSHGMSISDFPIFGQIGNRGFPDSRFWPNRESGIPSPTQIPGGNPRFPAGIPDSRPNRESARRGNGNRGFPGLTSVRVTWR
jgi:hypothetical protein